MNRVNYKVLSNRLRVHLGKETRINRYRLKWALNVVGVKIKMY